MKEVRREVERLVNLFMKPIDKFHNYPMCFDTAVQCSLIAINERLQEVPYLNNTTEECNRRIFLMDVRLELDKL